MNDSGFISAFHSGENHWRDNMSDTERTSFNSQCRSFLEHLLSWNPRICLGFLFFLALSWRTQWAELTSHASPSWLLYVSCEYSLICLPSKSNNFVSLLWKSFFCEIMEPFYSCPNFSEAAVYAKLPCLLCAHNDSGRQQFSSGTRRVCKKIFDASS